MSICDCPPPARDLCAAAPADESGVVGVEVLEACSARELDHVRGLERGADVLVPDLDPPAWLPGPGSVDD
jgi:hypothetical protein